MLGIHENFPIYKWLEYEILYVIFSSISLAGLLCESSKLVWQATKSLSEFYKQDPRF